MNKIDVPLRVRSMGRYRIDVVDSISGKTTHSGIWFRNLLTTSGVNNKSGQTLGSDFDSNNKWATYVAVGTSNTPPTVSGTTLGAYLAQQSISGSMITETKAGAPSYESKSVVRAQFATGAVVGNISEVGMATGTLGTGLKSHSLIKDSSGNPTTITLTSTDILIVYYELTVYPPLGDSTGTFTLTGDPLETIYSFTVRAATIASNWRGVRGLYNWSTGNVIQNTCYLRSGATLGGITGTPSGGTQYGPYTYSTAGGSWAYLIAPTIAQGNGSGSINVIHIISGQGPIQIEISPAIPKDALIAWSLTFRLVLSDATP